ncbi:MAG: hypothetical protein Q4D04_08435, partial [Clostridia bacterium]|nr:hypothetical protein [Clostridia bacterium]
LIKLENDVDMSFNLSWDAWSPNRGARLRVFGTDGTLYLPDPNGFSNDAYIIRKSDLLDGEGIITPEKMAHMDKYKKSIAPVHDLEGELRGIGLSEMADAILFKRENNICSGEFACHVTELLLGCDIAGSTEKCYRLRSRAKSFDIIDPDFFNRALA